MATQAGLTEADILERVVCPDLADLPPAAANAFLRLSFDRQATTQIRALLRKNNRGTISAEERMTLEKYLRVGQFIDLLRAKAKLSLQENGAAE